MKSSKETAPALGAGGTETVLCRACVRIPSRHVPKLNSDFSWCLFETGQWPDFLSAVRQTDGTNVFKLPMDRLEGRPMAQQRRHVKHKATFEERLAEEAINLKKPLKSNLPAALPGNCSCGVPNRLRRRLTYATGYGPTRWSRRRKASTGEQNKW